MARLKPDLQRQREGEGRYKAGRTGWDRGGVSPALLEWLESGELSPGKILIPGCGRGYEVVALAEAGFQVSAVDIAPSALEYLGAVLKAAGLTAELVEADVLRWEPGESFDAIYEQTSLCALPPADWPVYAERLWRWLRPDGRLFALFMQTGLPGGPPYHCDAEAMQALFRTDRWHWSARKSLQVPHSKGLHELGFILQRR